MSLSWSSESPHTLGGGPKEPLAGLISDAATCPLNIVTSGEVGGRGRPHHQMVLILQCILKSFLFLTLSIICDRAV